MTFSIGGRHKPNKVLQRALEILLILHADHEQNCSTSAVRARRAPRTWTRSPPSRPGIAALYGPLHGGANEAVLAMLDEIGDKKNIPAFIKEVKGGGGRLMGFGHRVYKSYDPRAKLIKRVADDVFAETGLNPEAGDRPGAGADRPAGRLLHQAEAVSQRGLLLRAHLSGDGVSDRVLHRALRPGADAGVAGPVGGDAAGQGPEDRPAAADLHRRRRSGRSSPSRSARHDRPARHPALAKSGASPHRGVRGAVGGHGRALRGGRELAAVLGERGAEPRVDSPVDPGARVEAPARQVVRRRQAQRRRSTASTGTSAAPGATRPRIIWEGEPGDRRVLTYWDLAREVGRCANALKRLGVQRGDRVAIYLPMIPEAAIAMLACARIGAVHSVVFGGFSAESLRDRINDAGAVALITADGGYRRGQIRAAQAHGRHRAGRRRPRSSTASWSAAGRAARATSRSPR